MGRQPTREDRTGPRMPEAPAHPRSALAPDPWTDHPRSARQDRDPPLAARIEAALAQGQHVLARRILGEAETMAALSKADAMLIRARIAQAQGDMAAARAILIAAAENHPDHRPARRALAEVMVAMGAAADVRAVLKHLARRPGVTRQEPPSAAIARDEGIDGKAPKIL